MSRRRYEQGELIACGSPAMRLRVDPSLVYLGTSSFDIKSLAIAERHYFVAVETGLVRRMLVAQFEAFLDSTDEVYRYSLPDPVILGGETFGSWVFGFSVASATAPETVDTLEVLSAHGLELDDEQIFARFARIVGDDARHEILVFYHENIRDLGHSLTDLCDDGAVRPEFADVARALKQRALASFSIAEEEDSYSDSE